MKSHLRFGQKSFIEAYGRDWYQNDSVQLNQSKCLTSEHMSLTPPWVIGLWRHEVTTPNIYALIVSERESNAISGV